MAIFPRFQWGRADTSNNTNIIKSRLGLLTRKAKEIGLDFVEPDGSMYLFAKVPKDEFDGGKFANSLLEYGLAVAPGVGFGDYKDFIRISAGRDEKELMDGMSILRRYLKE